MAHACVLPLPLYVLHYYTCMWKRDEKKEGSEGERARGERERGGGVRKALICTCIHGTCMSIELSLTAVLAKGRVPKLVNTTDLYSKVRNGSKAEPSLI